MQKKNERQGGLPGKPFDRLREMMEEKWEGLAEEHSIEGLPEDISDEELFREAMSKVREIKEFTEMPVERKMVRPIEKRAGNADDTMDILIDIASGRMPIDLSDTQEYVQWINPDARAFDAKRLHLGEYAVQDYIDLHGYTVAEALEETERYLRNCKKKGLLCVKVIHGRGLRSEKGPVVKDAVLSWLSGSFRKNIIAFVSARQCDGGLGAVYVLLKR